MEITDQGPLKAARVFNSGVRLPAVAEGVVSQEGRVAQSHLDALWKTQPHIQLQWFVCGCVGGCGWVCGCVSVGGGDVYSHREAVGPGHMCRRRWIFIHQR